MQYLPEINSNYVELTITHSKYICYSNVIQTIWGISISLWTKYLEEEASTEGECNYFCNLQNIL